MKSVAIIQPSFLPWRGFFSIISAVDTFVHYDDVQFDKDGWRNRNNIKTPNGLIWITVPVKTKGLSGQKINETSIVYDKDWARKILSSIRLSYSRAAHFDKYFEWLSSVLSQRWPSISDLNIRLTEDVCSFFSLKCTFVRSSQLKSRENLGRVERIVSICQELGATRYVSGPSAKSYITNPDLFTKNEIELLYYKYSFEPYHQIHGDFVPNVSILDVLMNCGGDARWLKAKDDKALIQQV